MGPPHPNYNAPNTPTPPYQFHLDAPRFAFYRNGTRLNSRNADAFRHLLHRWCLSHHYADPDTQVFPWCTQTGLARVICRLVLRVRMRVRMHL